MIMLIGLSITLLQGCVPNMVVHTGGKSGTFNESTAKNITSDKLDCDENVIQTYDYGKFAMSKYWEIATLGLIKAGETKTKKMKRKCLESLGHAVLD